MFKCIRTMPHLSLCTTRLNWASYLFRFWPFMFLILLLWWYHPCKLFVYQWLWNWHFLWFIYSVLQTNKSNCHLFIHMYFKHSLFKTQHLPYSKQVFLKSSLFRLKIKSVLPGTQVKIIGLTIYIFFSRII